MKKKLKPANKYVSRNNTTKERPEKQEKSSPASSKPKEAVPVPEDEGHVPKDERQFQNEADMTDVIVTDCLSESEDVDSSQTESPADGKREMTVADMSASEFYSRLEAAFINGLVKRDEQKKAEEEELQEEIRRLKEEEGIDVISPENAVDKCIECLDAIEDDFNMYVKHSNDISKQQEMVLETTKLQSKNIEQLKTLIYDVEDLTGVKVPCRPPFPSWKWIPYLIWHIPIYVLACIWHTRFFRKCCYLAAIIFMAIQNIKISNLRRENGALQLDHDIYIDVRNWSIVKLDKSAIQSFEYVESLYNDTAFNRHEIQSLKKFIYEQHERNIKEGNYKKLEDNYPL